MSINTTLSMRVSAADGTTATLVPEHAANITGALSGIVLTFTTTPPSLTVGTRVRLKLDSQSG